MIHAKKSFGQHFLINTSVIEKIVHYINDHRKGLPILEVGPGTAALSDHFVSESEYRAIELDREAYSYLLTTYPQQASSFFLGNFLKVDLANFLNHKEYGLIGNFPYNISSQIVFRLLEHVEIFPFMVGMFQKEVAQRILSKHGSKTYGILSVLVASLYEGSTVTRLSPGSFKPPPRVDSTVISLKRKADFQENLKLYKELKTVVKMSFNQRRKMLRTSLKSLKINHHLGKMNMGDKRPEQLSLEAYMAIAEMYQKHKKEL